MSRLFKIPHYDTDTTRFYRLEVGQHFCFVGKVSAGFIIYTKGRCNTYNAKGYPTRVADRMAEVITA